MYSKRLCGNLIVSVHINIFSKGRYNRVRRTSGVALTGKRSAIFAQTGANTRQV